METVTAMCQTCAVDTHARTHTRRQAHIGRIGRAVVAAASIRNCHFSIYDSQQHINCQSSRHIYLRTIDILLHRIHVTRASGRPTKYPLCVTLACAINSSTSFRNFLLLLRSSSQKTKYEIMFIRSMCDVRSECIMVCVEQLWLAGSLVIAHNDLTMACRQLSSFHSTL